MLEQRLIDEMVEFLGVDVAATLLLSVVLSINEHMATLRATIDSPQAVLSAHRLHGLSATYGLTRLADATAAIECVEVTGEDLVDLMKEVEKAAEEAKVELRVCATRLRQTV